MLECAAFEGAYAIHPQKLPEDLRSAPSRDDYDIFRQASTWLTHCLSHHRGCREQPDDDTTYPLSRLPSRLLDLSHGSSVLVVNVFEWISLGLAITAELSEYCTVSYLPTGSQTCILAVPFAKLLELPLSSMLQTFQRRNYSGPYPRRPLPLDRRPVHCSAKVRLEMIRTGAPRDPGWESFAIFTIAATCAESADECFLAKVGSSVHRAEPSKVIMQTTMTTTRED